MLLFEVKAQSSDPISTNVQSVKVLQNPLASIDLPSLSNPQNAESPSHPEHPFEVLENKTPTSPENPQIPQVPDDNGLLDGIEEPMQVRRISMDFSSEDNNFVGDFVEGGVVSLPNLLVPTNNIIF